MIKHLEKTTAEEMLQAAELNWNVSKVQTHLADGTIIPNVFVTKRDDTGHIFGPCSSSYQVLQNREASSIADALVGMKEAHYVGAGSFRQGARVFLQLQMPGTLRPLIGDDVNKMLLVSTSHDGSSPVHILFTPIRVVCQNTLLAAIQSARNIFTVRHTESMKDRLLMAQKALGLANKHFTVFEQLSEKLVKTPFKQADLEQYVKKAGIIPNATENSTRAKNIMEEISRLFEAGKGTEIPGVRGTAWGAYNAVTEYIDHYRGSNTENREENRFYGQGANMKQRALDLVAAL